MNKSSPLVTIAIPTHNRAGTHLPDALRCALGQTYARMEVIVADNASTDHTRDLVGGLSDRRVRYFRHGSAVRPNDNFNFCVQKAAGKYLLLLLDDEQVDPDFVETCVSAVDDRSGVGLVRTGLRTIDAHGTVIAETSNDAVGLPLHDLFLAWFDNRTAFYLCNTLFETEAIREAGGLQSRHCLFQDVMAQVRIAARRGRVDVPAIKASTRSHPAQFTYSAGVGAWAEDALDLLELMCGVAPDKQALVRTKGERFFALISYSRASMIRSPRERLAAYALVHRLYGRRHLPPPRMVLASTTAYRRLRDIKRRWNGQPAWAAAG